MSRQGHYDVVLHTGPGIVQAHATFPFGRWAEIGFWLDEHGADEGDTASITFHPLRVPLASGAITCPTCGSVTHWEGEPADECLGCGTELGRPRPEEYVYELHSVRHELHPAGRPDVAHAERLAAELRGDVEGWRPGEAQDETLTGLGDFDGGAD